MNPSSWKKKVSAFPSQARTLFPGFLIAFLIALASQFISDHYGAPSMMMALLFGMSLNFLVETPNCKPGILFSAKAVLRFGVALLGMRINFEVLGQLGFDIIVMIIGGVTLTILFGLLLSRFLGSGSILGFLSAGSVAICGVSAAIAIASVLPKDKKSEEHLVFTMVGVTILSTFAMIMYPIISGIMDYDNERAGIFLGATIHDVAQVIGAGFSVSETTGEFATVVKLFRVALLAPVVLIASLTLGRAVSAGKNNKEKPTYIPGFLIVFIILMTLNSFSVFPETVAEISVLVSRWALLAAIAAVGMKTSLKEVMKVGNRAISLLVAETLFLAIFVISALYVIDNIL